MIRWNKSEGKNENKGLNKQIKKVKKIKSIGEKKMIRLIKDGRKNKNLRLKK